MNQIINLTYFLCLVLACSLKGLKGVILLSRTMLTYGFFAKRNKGLIFFSRKILTYGVFAKGNKGFSSFSKAFATILLVGFSSLLRKILVFLLLASSVTTSFAYDTDDHESKRQRGSDQEVNSATTNSSGYEHERGGTWYNDDGSISVSHNASSSMKNDPFPHGAEEEPPQNNSGVVTSDTESTTELPVRTQGPDVMFSVPSQQAGHQHASESAGSGGVTSPSSDDGGYEMERGNSDWYSESETNSRVISGKQSPTNYGGYVPRTANGGGDAAVSTSDVPVDSGGGGYSSFFGWS